MSDLFQRPWIRLVSMPLGFYSTATIVGLGPYYSRYPRQDINGIGNSIAGLVPLRVLLGGGRG